MTTPSPATGASEAAQSPSGGLPVRLLTVWALLALAAVVVFFQLMRWIFPPTSLDFLHRINVEQFANPYVLVAPMLAVLLAAKVGTALRSASVVSLAATLIYSAALLFGGLAFLLTIAQKFDGLDRLQGIHTFGAALWGLGSLIYELILVALLALGALWSFTIFRSLGGKLPTLSVDSQ